jgi:hypothetical protein
MHSPPPVGRKRKELISLRASSSERTKLGQITRLHNLEENAMDTHVKVVGWLWIVWGVGSILMVIIGLAVINWPGNVPSPRDTLIVTSGILCFFLPGIIADFVAGYGLLNYKSWARYLSIILAVINLVFLCALIIPAALGIYTLVIMFNKETVALFRGEGTPAEMEEVS